MGRRSDIADSDIRQLFRSAPALLLVLRPDSRFTILDATKMYLLATMTARRDLIGRGLFEAFPDNPANPNSTGEINLRTSLERVVATKQADSMAIQHYDIPRPVELGGGFEERYWSPHNTPVLDDSGELAFIIHRVEDVTGYMRLSQTSRQQRELADVLQARNQEMEAEIIRRSRELADTNARLHNALSALTREKQQIEAILRAIGDAVVTTDDNGRVSYINAAAERLTGWQSAEVIGRDPGHWLILQDGKPAVSGTEARRTIHAGNTGVADYHLTSRNGRKLTVAANISPIRSHDDEGGGLVVVMRDVTQERRWAEELSFQARHDPLTGLANRTEFRRRLEHALEGARHGATHVLCMIDLDRFKQVNDLGGHDAGDEMLRQIAMQLSKLLRQRDTLARMGGDEFVCLFEHCAMEQGQHLADSLLHAIQSITLSRNGRIHRVNASMGLTLVDAACGHADQVLQTADAACYAAKSRGCGRVYVGSADQFTEMPEPGERWLKPLNQALEQNRLGLFVQPITALGAGPGATHFEILVRLPVHHRWVQAAKFMPLAERHRLAPRVDRWVIDTVLAYLAGRGNMPIQPESVFFINIADSSLVDLSLPAFIESRLHHWQVPARRIAFEISETGALNRQTDALLFARTVKALGCRLSLDDVLYALPQVEILRELHADFLKPSGRLTQNLEDASTRALLDAINRVGMSLGSHTIAKRPGNGRSLAIIKQLGIGHVQGNLIAEPYLLNPSQSAASN